MDGMRNVLKVSELNNRVKEWEYQESLRGKYESWRGRACGIVTSSQTTHIIINIHPLAHVLDICALIFSSCAIFTVYPNRIM